MQRVGWPFAAGSVAVRGRVVNMAEKSIVIVV